MSESPEQSVRPIEKRSESPEPSVKPLEIRSESSELPFKPLEIRRKRASTKQLLGDKYNFTSGQIFEPPVPPDDVEGYNTERIKLGLRYASSTLQQTERKLSPIGIRALILYKDACAALLHMEKQRANAADRDFEDATDEDFEEAKEQYLAVIRSHEREQRFLACLKATSTSNAAELEEELVKLLRMLFFCRYGDALAETCKRLKNVSESKKVAGWELLTKEYGYWTEFAKGLEKETKSWELVLKGKPEHDNCPLHMAVTQACRSISFNSDEMLEIIKLYAERNELLHANFQYLIKNGQFHTLSRQLYKDFCDIPKVIAVTEGVQAKLLLRLLECTIETWFTRDSEDPNNHEMWFPTEALLCYKKELQGKRSAAEIHKEMTKNVVDKLAKLSADTNRTKKLAENIENLAAKIKRVASSQLQAELDSAKRMKVDHDKLINIAYQLRKFSDSYLSKYGTTDPPPIVEEDPTLD